MNLDIAAIICGVGALVGVIAQHYRVLNKIEHRLSALETKIGPFWKIVEERVAELLHSPTNKVKDDLLEKLQVKSITPTEVCELKCILEQEVNRSDKKPLALAYYLVIARLEVLIENTGMRR